MKMYLYLILFFLILLNGCAKHNPIDFTSSEAFFSSLSEKKRVQKENKRNIAKTIKFKDKKIKELNEQNVKKTLMLTFFSYNNHLKQKIGSNENTILEIFNSPNQKIIHGKVKNLQFHLKSCHLDLFFLNEDGDYYFRHFDIRPSRISSVLNEKECVKELNAKFILIRDPK